MRIKYMGSADEKRYAPTEDFSSQLPEPIGIWLKFNWENNHIIDTDDDEYKDLSPEVWELVVEEPDMMDVTGMPIIPVNLAQRLWRGMRDPGDASPYRFPHYD